MPLGISSTCITFTCIIYPWPPPPASPLHPARLPYASRACATSQCINTPTSAVPGVRITSQPHLCIRHLWCPRHISTITFASRPPDEGVHVLHCFNHLDVQRIHRVTILQNPVPNDSLSCTCLPYNHIRPNTYLFHCVNASHRPPTLIIVCHQSQIGGPTLEDHHAYPLQRVWQAGVPFAITIPRKGISISSARSGQSDGFVGRNHFPTALYQTAQV